MCRSQRWHGMMVVSFILSVVAGACCPLVLVGPSKTLNRDAGLILSMDPTVGTGELGVLENADILLDGGTIAELGKHLQGHGAQVVDATGEIVLPGFVDVHNHLWQSLIRGCGTDKDLIRLARDLYVSTG